MEEEATQRRWTIHEPLHRLASTCAREVSNGYSRARAQANTFTAGRVDADAVHCLDREERAGTDGVRKAVHATGKSAITVIMPLTCPVERILVQIRGSDVCSAANFRSSLSVLRNGCNGTLFSKRSPPNTLSLPSLSFPPILSHPSNVNAGGESIVREGVEERRDEEVTERGPGVRLGA
eukprot:899945-Rhodomonas_salina.3